MKDSHRVEYFLAVKRNEIPVDAATWIHLENIILSKRSQSQTTIYDSVYMKFPIETNLYRDWK